MKILLITPSTSYSVGMILRKGFLKNNHEVIVSDYIDNIAAWKEQINSQVYRFPYQLRERWVKYYLEQINKRVLQQFYEVKPDVVFIYNDAQLLPETVIEMRKTSKVGFYLGDNPFYSWRKYYFIEVLMEANHVFVPDSFWQEQLQMLGMEKVDLEILGSDEDVFFKMQPTVEQKAKYEHDLFFIGTTYSTSWGYKRARFLSKFTDLDIVIYGKKNWFKWFKYFPELEKRFVIEKEYISYSLLNEIINCCKIYPVDANPGILNGLHIRIFDCIASGILPLVEYRKDIETVFKGVELPVIKNYNESKEIAQYYLDHPAKRLEVIENLRKHVLTQYKPEYATKRMLDRIFS